ncbi:MAG: bifunctional precorrin-2 dehydrogenase/sirohydrochlorin ferrochelatase [Lachnospiraceae bacterium]|nr:bifunctional precorrin-2 dehydrogenase/sirohydrochlorin ferrochelatase [Lachnospiraceae bacterium]
MAYFPFYFELEGKLGVIVGGGKVALEKIEKLSGFGAVLRVIAPDVLPEIEAIKKTDKNLIIVNKEFAPEDISGADYLIAATGNEKLNAEIFSLCRERHIPVNVVDDRDKCDFIFPSVIKRGNLVASVTSSGDSPQVAVRLRRKFEELIPDNIEEILDYLGQLRVRVKDEVTDGYERHSILKKAADLCMELGRPLTDEEIGGLMSLKR